eukprot:m.331910 g.331910  ORF g.331910 m.331910 type:complete len:354 (+) comp16814_c0_seq1:97-1158(+)
MAVLKVVAVVALTVALTGGAGASICTTLSDRRDECVSLGCKYSGNRCQQPDSCTNSGSISYQGQSTGVSASRLPMAIPEHASLCTSNPECSAIYTVYLQDRFSTGPPNCNDIGMLPPHGNDQTKCATINPATYSRSNSKNYENHPFPNDAVKQASARALNAQTALTEDSEGCDENENCAFPLGFKTDTLHKGKAVCVVVRNAQEKWVEIMASSRKGSDGGSYCVSDWGEGEDQACTKEGDLYECRESGNSPFGDSMTVKFYAQDNVDDANIKIFWRITASKLPKGQTGQAGEEKDAEDWCQFRDGGDYPLTLMGAYPIEFEGNPVFDKTEDSATTVFSGIILSIACVFTALFL